jgi:hypothetical protein
MFSSYFIQMLYAYKHFNQLLVIRDLNLNSRENYNNVRDDSLSLFIFSLTLF